MVNINPETLPVDILNAVSDFVEQTQEYVEDNPYVVIGLIGIVIVLIILVKRK